MPVKDALSAAVKQGMLTLGQYRRTLARTTLPGVAVLGYHGLRADDLPADSMAFENLHVRASTFDAHCRVVRECCDPITLDDWRQAAAGRTPLPPRPVLITFDDGYRSVARMTVDDVIALSRSGHIEIGGHTSRHPILARASREQQREEIAGNCEAIQSWTGRTVRAFAYPNGRPGVDYDDTTIDLLAELGIDTAFTMRPSFARPGERALERSRFLMVDAVSGAELAHRLAHTWPR